MNALPSYLVNVALALYESADTPYSLSLAIKLKAKDWVGILAVEPDPRSYSSPAIYARDAACFGFFKKFKGLPTGINLRQSAIEKWWDGERSCYRANVRLVRYLPEFFNSSDRVPAIEATFDLIRKEIRSLLGPKPPEVSNLVGRFGPGATSSDRGDKSTIPDKIASVPTLTRGALWFLPSWLETKWGAASALLHEKVCFVDGNRFATVPKTAKTDRSIASEPPINVFYQLSVGRLIRQKFLQAGWDLAHAQDIHRLVAEESSVTREFCTLDLSNASDTLCSNLVKLLLPRPWFELLSSLRSAKTQIDGEWVMLEKFSSMGNGFTFELETLIFAAIACVASKQCGHIGRLGVDVFVFGDDIIVKDDVYRVVSSILAFCGFELNRSKSFSGDFPFRESCGGDFFLGKNVRPFFLKGEPDGLDKFLPFANGLRAALVRIDACGVPIRRSAWFRVLDNLPSWLRQCRGPQVLGDAVIHDEESTWRPRWRNGIRYFRSYRPHRLRIKKYAWFHPAVVLACATYGCGNRQGGVVPRDSVLSYKLGWLPRS